MKLKSLLSKFTVSTRKFYEIVAEKQKEMLPSTPQEFVISKYLHDRNFQQGINKNSQTKQSNPPQKYPTNLVNYQQIIQKYPHGSVIEKTFKDVDLNLLSVNFQKIQLRELYQVLQQFAPDLILVEGRPQCYLPHFQQIIKNQDVFSDKLYLEQILQETPEKIKQFVLSQSIDSKLNEILNGIKNQSKQNNKIFIKDHKGAIDDTVILTAAHYASANNKALLFGDIPQQPWRQWICNSHTLMEMQQLFKSIAKNLPFYQSLGLTLQQLGAILKPQLFLNLRDRYIATLIEMIVATNKYKKVLCLMGVMENEAVMQVLQRQLLIQQNPLTKEQHFTPLLEYLIGPPIKSSILRNIHGWQIIEKHIIFDILHHGEQVMEIPFESLASTNKIIEHYGVQLNSYPQENIMKFRYEKSVQYLNIMREQIREGRQLRQKFMLRQAMRQSEDSY